MKQSGLQVMAFDLYACINLTRIDYLKNRRYIFMPFIQINIKEEIEKEREMSPEFKKAWDEL